MNLNDVMGIESVTEILPDGTVIENVRDVYAPDLFMGTDGDGQILDEHEQDYIEQARREGWELLTGWTGQYSYHGPVMHPSEYIGGALAAHIRATPGIYAVIAVETDNDDADYDEPAGWAIAYRESRQEGNRS